MIINRGKTEREIASRYSQRVLDREKTPKPTPEPTPTEAPVETPEGVFIFSYDDFGKDLIAKSNQIFQGTRAEIPLADSGEVPNMYVLKRNALITTCYRHGIETIPIDPLQSELLLRDGKLPHPNTYWEYLALILYSTQGRNVQEANALYQSLKQHRAELGLSESDLEARLLVVNSGLEKDETMPHGVKPVVLPGLTRVYPHDVLSKTCEHPSFEYGLEHGLPAANKLGTGNRTLYMPTYNKNLGLRPLYRNGNLDLNAWIVDLVYPYADGRVNFARKGTN